MDQVKSALAWAKKNHFWIACGLSVVIALALYFVGSSKLDKYFNDQKAKAKSAEGDIASLRGSDHPNENWKKAVEQLTIAQRNDVLTAWTNLYADQAKVFQWPKDKELGDNFWKAFSGPYPSKDPNISDYCEQYQRFITMTMLPRMAKIIDAQWTGGVENIKMKKLPGAAAADDDSKVFWADEDQKRQYQNYAWPFPPSELDVRYAQEEMWVMQALFDAIAKANSTASARYNAAVREVDAVQIGYDAVGKHPLGEGENRVVHHKSRDTSVPGANGPIVNAIPGAGPAGAGPGVAAGPIEAKRPPRDKMYGDKNDASSAIRTGGGITGPNVGPPGGGPVQGGPGQAPAGGGANDLETILKEGRYVDSDGKPIAAAEMATKQAAEYKLMAFRLRLRVDSTKFHEVIASFIDSTVPIELREVRVNVDMMDPMERGGEVGPRHIRPNPSGSGGSSPVNEIPLELAGVVYIVNPPDPAKLGVTAADAATGAAPGTAPPPGAPAPAAPATTPAAAPATAATGTPPAVTPTATQPGTAPAPTPAATGTAPVTGATPTPAATTPAAPTATVPAESAPAAPATQSPPTTTTPAPATPTPSAPAPAGTGAGLLRAPSALLALSGSLPLKGRAGEG